MSNPQRFERNLGFLSTEEQSLLKGSRIAIAGAGGDGGMLAVQLARMGVGELRLADPDPFEIENINRQAVCTDKTLGVNKAEAVANYIQDINPDIRVSVFTDGINAENTEEFVAGADLLIDETEFTQHVLAVMLAREARKHDVPNLTAMNIGFAAIVTTFHPHGKSVEKTLGLSEKAPLDEIAEENVSLTRWLPYLPKYVDLKVFEKVSKGEKSAPSVAPGVAIAAGTGATQAMLNLTKGANHRPKPVYSPNALLVDIMSVKSKVIRHDRASFYRHYAGVLLRNTLKINPQADY